MNDHHTATGTITHIFAHRFVVETASGPILADVTPEGAKMVQLRLGAQIELAGEMRPSELKVSTLKLDGHTIHIDHKKKHDHLPPLSQDDLDIVLAAARAAGYEPCGEPRRKPKHVELLTIRQGKLAELHVERDGRIRKQKPVEPGSVKWGDAGHLAEA